MKSLIQSGKNRTLTSPWKEFSRNDFESYPHIYRSKQPPVSKINKKFQWKLGFVCCALPQLRWMMQRSSLESTSDNFRWKTNEEKAWRSHRSVTNSSWSNAVRNCPNATSRGVIHKAIRLEIPQTFGAKARFRQQYFASPSGRADAAQLQSQAALSEIDEGSHIPCQAWARENGKDAIRSISAGQRQFHGSHLSSPRR